MRVLLAILLLLLAAPAEAQQGQGMSQALVVSSCGGGALPSGPLTQLTMDTTGRLCQSGIGSNVCSQATAYLARTTGGNEGGNAVNITALICGLVTDGIIDGTLTGANGCGSHLDVLYILAQQNKADALLNICGTNYPLSAAEAFSSYVGFPAPLNGGSLFDPSIAISPHYTQNNASYGFWSYAVIAEAYCQVGNGVSGNTAIYDKFTDNNFISAINGTGFPRGPTTITKGLFVADRSNASNVYGYQNGVSPGPIANSSSAVDAGQFNVGACPSAAFGNSAETINEVHIGGSLGATLNLALYNRLRTYMTAVGVP